MLLAVEGEIRHPRLDALRLGLASGVRSAGPVRACYQWEVASLANRSLFTPSSVLTVLRYKVEVKVNIKRMARHMLSETPTRRHINQGQEKSRMIATEGSKKCKLGYNTSLENIYEPRRGLRRGPRGKITQERHMAGPLRCYMAEPHSHMVRRHGVLTGWGWR